MANQAQPTQKGAAVTLDATWVAAQTAIAQNGRLSAWGALQVVVRLSSRSLMRSAAARRSQPKETSPLQMRCTKSTAVTVCLKPFSSSI